MRLARTLGAAVVAATVTACTLAPHYERPAAPVAATWTGGTPPSTNTTAAPDIGWRQFFPDPGMQRLIELALANNRDLRVAALNVQATQAQYRIQRATLFPPLPPPGSSRSRSILPVSARHRELRAGRQYRRPDDSLL